MSDNGWFEVQYSYTEGIGDEIASITWRGAPLAVAHRRLLDDLGYDPEEQPKAGDKLSIGPYRAAVVMYDFSALGYLVRRDDTLGWLYAMRWRVLRRWRWVAVRWAETMRIWGIRA